MIDFTDEQLERYARHLILMDIGGVGQTRLLQASVAVVGAGGLGVPVIAYLAAAGVGHIRVIDPDTVSLSNLQRQFAYRMEDIDTPKAVAAQRFVEARNPDVTIETHVTAITGDTSDLLEGVDVIADCSDNFACRLLVNRVAVQNRIPLVSAALGQFEGQLASFRPWDGPDLPCYQCFVPALPPEDLQATCSDQGILGTVAGIIGTLQAQEVVKEILRLGQSLAGKLMLIDSLGARQRLIGLPRDPCCPICADLDRKQSEAPS